jgi:hypothetical protein
MSRALTSKEMTSRWLISVRLSGTLSSWRTVSRTHASCTLDRPHNTRSLLLPRCLVILILITRILQDHNAQTCYSYRWSILAIDKWLCQLQSKKETKSTIPRNTLTSSLNRAQSMGAALMSKPTFNSNRVLTHISREAWKITIHNMLRMIRLNCHKLQRKNTTMMNNSQKICNRSQICSSSMCSSNSHITKMCSNLLTSQITWTKISFLQVSCLISMNLSPLKAPKTKTKCKWCVIKSNTCIMSWTS